MSGSEHNAAMSPAFDIVLFAASLGGVRAYSEVLSALPADLPAAVVLTQHRRNTGVDNLPYLLSRSSSLPVHPVADGERPTPGTVHVAPAGSRVRITGDRHLAVDGADSSALDRSGDALFASAAGQYGRRALGVVLTGRLDDAADGARALKHAGGRVLVQQPSDAQAAAMPTATLATGCIDWALPLRLITPAVVALVMAPGAASLLRVTPPPWAAMSVPSASAGVAGTATRTGRHNHLAPG